MKLTAQQQYKILYDIVTRVERFPPDFDPVPLYESLREVKLAIDQNDILRRDLDEQAKTIMSLRKQIEEMRV